MSGVSSAELMHEVLQSSRTFKCIDVKNKYVATEMNMFNMHNIYKDAMMVLKYTCMHCAASNATMYVQPKEISGNLICDVCGNHLPDQLTYIERIVGGSKELCIDMTISEYIQMYVGYDKTAFMTVQPNCHLLSFESDDNQYNKYLRWDSKIPAGLDKLQKALRKNANPRAMKSRLMTQIVVFARGDVYYITHSPVSTFDWDKSLYEFNPPDDNVFEITMEELYIFISSINSQFGEDTRHLLTDIKEVMDRTFRKTFRWRMESRTSHPSQVLTAMYTSTTHDIEFVIDGVKIPAHRCVIAAVSEFFNRLLYTRDFSECAKKEIELHDIHADVFREVIKFIYTGEFHMDNIADVDNLRKCVDMYDIAELQPFLI